MLLALVVLVAAFLPGTVRADGKIEVKSAGSTVESRQANFTSNEVQLDGGRSVALSEVDVVTFLGAPEKKRTEAVVYHELYLVDGSVLRISKFVFGSDSSQFVLWNAFDAAPAEAQVAFPVSNARISGFLRNAHDTRLQRQFADLAASAKVFDRLVVRVEEDRLDAIDVTVESFANTDGKLVYVNQSAGNAKASTLSWTRPAGLILPRRGEARPEPPIAYAEDKSGSRFAIARAVTTKEGLQLYGLDTKALPPLFLAQPSRIDFASARGTAFASLEARIESPWPSDPIGHSAYSRNETIARRRIRIDGKKGEARRHFAGGVCLAAGASVEVRLGKKFHALTAFVGVDADSDVDSEGILEVIGDGRVLAKLPYSTSAEGQSLQVEDLNSTDKLSLRVSRQGLPDVGSSVCLGGATLRIANTKK